MSILNTLFGWRKFGAKKGDLVLEIGSGGSPWIRSNILVEKYLHDDSQRELNATKDRPLVCADIIDLPFKKDSFDFIYASHVVEHLDDIVKGLNEIAYVGKKWVIIVPGEIFERIWDKHSHRWIITEEENTLVFREKCPCTRLKQNDALDRWKPIFWKSYSENKELLDIHFFWENSITFKIIRCKEGGFEKNGTVVTARMRKVETKLKDKVKMKILSLLSGIIRTIEK